MAPATSWISARKNRSGSWFLSLVLATAGLTACDKSSTDLSRNEQEPDATVLFPGLTVSDTKGGGALMGATEGVAYVSASPGTFSDADQVTLTNLANGETQTVPLVEGGFDPVPQEAQPGDEIEILVHHNDGTIRCYLTKVPPRKRPRVVRTVPPKDATDVVLSASLAAVFSEPVNPSTVTTQNVRLEIAGQLVAGTLTLSDDGLRTEFMPDEPLQPLTAYRLVITSGILDLEGDPLEEETSVTFTTEDSAEVIQWTEIELCAKQTVIDEINQIEESDAAGWQGPEIDSTTPACGVSDGPYAPHGTLRYSLNGPQFQFEFYGEGFVPPEFLGTSHGVRYTQHVLVVYPEPWPGENLMCLDGHIGDQPRRPTLNGRLYLRGSLDLGTDLRNAKLWIVRRDWVDCTGSDENEPHWSNRDRVPRLTNDRNDDGEADVSEVLIWCWPNCDYGTGDLAYDWLFETALINYRDTDG